MKREIKFRGKRVNGGEWIESMTISYGTIERKANCVFFEIREGNWQGVLPETVGQFTGLLDKNGKEIYKGDILLMSETLSDETGSLKRVNTYYEVGIKNGCFGYIGENTGELLPFCQYKIVEDIAGNVFDNPELLKRD